ncbi:hypothetical protein GSI_05626 [Ganoderma sinense ZZ0214-1]|uniref:Uncharacterized protein n=1 Tax=Ganoderma sinense ZZ0214-1 TaxID=1077348 RepID=A0A2G8SF43_9APHY|nr:hypothetical protein GSI_05626 [Ganoderma sinense ZZ0214-1]
MYSITLPSLNPYATYLAPGEKASERGRAAVTVPVTLALSLGSRWESEPEEPVAPERIPDLHNDGREDRPCEEDLRPVL